MRKLLSILRELSGDNKGDPVRTIFFALGMEPMDSGVEIYYAKETCENLEGDNIEEHGLKMEMTR